MSINTQGLPPYDEQRTKKLEKKPVYVAPMNIIKQLKAKEINVDKLKPKKK